MIRELRIGNWFIEKDEVKQFDGDFYHLLGHDPIPLTEEWLFKFGFERMYFFGAPLNYLLKEPICVSTHDMVIEWNKPNFIIKQIQYVHEIQNLYFELTGKELEIDSKLSEIKK